MDLEQKPILIVGALITEVNYLIEKLENKIEKKISIFDIYEGTYHGYPVIIAKTGVGLVKASSCLSLVLDKYDPCFVLNEGTAGGITKIHHKKDIVIATETFNFNSYKSQYKELGEGSDSRDWEIMQFSDGGTDEKKVYYTDEELLKLVKYLDVSYEHGNVFEGIVGSGDAWNREKDKLNYLYEKHNVSCEDMEAVSIYEIAKNFNKKVLAIKIMSDNELLGEDYDKNVATYCQEYVYNLLTKIIEN